MAQITLTIPDNVVPRVLDAIAATQGYDEFAQPGETKAEFARRYIKAHVKRLVIEHESNQAADAALAAQRAQTNAEVDIT